MTQKTPNGCIIISGGSRGLGLAFVRMCLESGVPVATFARNATHEIENLKNQYKDSLLFETVDAVEHDHVKKFVNKAATTFKTIYAVINNAAIGQDHLLVHLPESKLDQIIAVNIKAPILLTRAALKHMLLGNTGGRIINISSICGTRGYPGLTVYAATKGALNAFTRSLAREVGPRGILVNAIAPGFFSSEMSEVLTPEQMETIRRRSATEKLTTPEDVLPVLRSLLFDHTNITGQIIQIDGGAST